MHTHTRTHAHTHTHARIHTHTHAHTHTQVLFRSYFAEGKNVNSEPVLRALLEEVGLDPEKALALLQNKKAVERFEDGIREALRKGEM